MIHFTPATIYAGTDGGFFKSTNGGTSWNPFNSGLTAPSVQALAIDHTTPATIYAGAWNPGNFFNGGGVFKSTNGGTSWTAINSGLTATAVQAVAIDPATPATLYAGAIGSQVPAYSVFKSINGGTSWAAASSGLPTSTDINALAIDPFTPATIYAGTGDLFSGGGGVFKSTDRGTTWQLNGAGAPACSYAISPLGQAFYYPGGASGGTATATVTAGSGCAWTATSNSSFLTITSGSSGSGNGTVGYSVAANPGTGSRTGTLTIAGQTLLVTQAGTVCTFAVSPSSQAFAASGGIASVSVKTEAICSWPATSNSSFLSIIGIPVGTRPNGNGSFAYFVEANPGTGSRAGTLTVADQTFTVTQAGNPNPTSSAPSITSRGIVPVGSSTATIQPGEWVSIYGSNLASGTVSWNGDFPTSLGRTSVTVNGKKAYLWYVSPGQINLQSPDDTARGSVLVVVTTANGSSTSAVTLGDFGPSFLLLDNKHVTGIIFRSNGSGAFGGGSYDIIGPTGTSLGYPTVAAKAGDVIGLFGVGFGPTNPAVVAGRTFTGAAATLNPVTLLINGRSVIPSFAGLSGAGLYQINLTVPSGLGTGDVSLQGSVGGVQTQPSVVISLQ